MYNHQDYIERNKRQPSTHKFKVGDWVTCNTRVLLVHYLYKHEMLDSDKNLYPLSELSLWKPQPGEWIWVWGTFNPHPVLRKLLSIYQETKFKVEPVLAFSQPHIYNYAQPFIGTLPEQLKDVK